MMASLFGFTNTAAKQEEAGFFLGFPSYWNIYAFYAGLWFTHHGPYIPAMVLGLLTVLTVLPVRFVYPNLITQPWRGLLVVTAIAWLGVLLLILPRYPDVPAWLRWVSLSYPGLYIGMSVYLDIVARQQHRRP
jgi:phosphatidylcholine synthase